MQSKSLSNATKRWLKRRDNKQSMHNHQLRIQALWYFCRFGEKFVSFLILICCPAKFPPVSSRPFFDLGSNSNCSVFYPCFWVQHLQSLLRVLRPDEPFILVGVLWYFSGSWRWWFSLAEDFSLSLNVFLILGDPFLLPGTKTEAMILQQVFFSAHHQRYCNS